MVSFERQAEQNNPPPEWSQSNKRRFQQTLVNGVPDFQVEEENVLSSMESKTEPRMHAFLEVGEHALAVMEGHQNGSDQMDMKLNKCSRRGSSPHHRKRINTEA